MQLVGALNAIRQMQQVGMGADRGPMTGVAGNEPIFATEPNQARFGFSPTNTQSPTRGTNMFETPTSRTQLPSGQISPTSPSTLMGAGAQFASQGISPGSELVKALGSGQPMTNGNQKPSAEKEEKKKVLGGAGY